MKFRYSVLLGLTLSGATAITAVAQTPTPSQKDMAWQRVINYYQAFTQALADYHQLDMTAPPPPEPKPEESALSEQDAADFLGGKDIKETDG